MDDANSDIKGMKLYHHTHRVMNELRELGKNETEALRVDELTGFDQLHYHGTEAVDEAIRAAGINERSTVLEIGSGLGGAGQIPGVGNGSRGDSVGAPGRPPPHGAEPHGAVRLRRQREASLWRLPDPPGW